MKKIKTGTKKTFSKYKKVLLKGFHKKKLEINFKGGDVTSDGGVLLLRQADLKMGLTQSLSKILSDPRNPFLCEHSHISMLKQRIYGLALGYEDLNDHDHLRKDPAICAAVNREVELASTPTLWRMEQWFKPEDLSEVHKLFLDKLFESYESEPKEIVLDFDATDDIVHGKQEGRFYNGYYKNYCFLPLYVFCGQQLLVSYLRKSNQDGAKHAWAILALLVKNIRKVWPNTKITFRGDSGFCRRRMLYWCDNHDVEYFVGIGKNSRLLQLAEPYISKAKEYFDHTQEKQRIFGEVNYAAGTWKRKRRIIVKAEHSEKGSNPRFVVTNSTRKPQQIYDEIYCARGDMENRIKEQQLDLFADRTSCQKWWPNQFRLLLSSLAYVLKSHIRLFGLKGTKLAKAQAGTIRLRLLKIGAVITKNTRRIRFSLSSAYPYQDIFLTVLARLTPS